MKLNLNNVTLCVADSVTPDLSLRAIRKSQEACKFSRAILFTDAKHKTADNCEIIPIRRLESINDYSYFLLKEIGSHIQTEFVLIIQWDGYVINPRAWNDDFMKYDYIGAKWEWFRDENNVGNGGFSLRSKKLLDATSSSSFEFVQDVPEDIQICRINKQVLTDSHALRFAPTNIADLFSYERSLPIAPTFGFHGLFNMWRHCNDEQMIDLIDDLTPRTYQSREFAELMIRYFELRKFEPVRAMYLKIKSVQLKDDFTHHLAHLTNDHNFANFFVGMCEKLA